MRRSSHRIAGLVSVIALFVFSSCQSFPDRFYEEGLNAAAEAEASGVDAPLRALRPRLEKAKLRADADYAAVSALNAWAAYYLKRNEPDKALPLLDEADAVSLSADFNRYRRYTTTLRALVAFQRGDATSALETVGKARSIRDPSYDDGPDPKLGYVEVYILQSLGRFEEASEAGRPYLEDRYSSSLDMIRSILAWNALHAGKPEAAIRYNKTSDWTEPHRKLIAYLAQLAITGPEGAELQAKQWLEYGSPKTRKDWLIDERYVCFPLDDPKAFFRAEYDEAELKALASYAIALGPNNRKRSGSALEYRLPIAAVGNPYPVDYAYAEAIMKERHSAAADSEKLEAYLKAASLGTPRLPWGIAAQASFHLWKRSDRASAEELCRRGMALYPGNRATFSLLLVQKAFRDGDHEASLGWLEESMGMEMNGLERDEALVARALFLLFYSQGDIQTERDIWAKEYPESAAIPYFDALQKFLKERSNPYIRAQDENYEKWRFQSAGDPRQALLYEWLSRASGKF